MTLRLVDCLTVVFILKLLVAFVRETEYRRIAVFALDFVDFDF